MEASRTPESADVVIMGGGLAGLSLAIQLRQRIPDLDVVVLERLRHPVPEAAHKVGESSVEIGAHYFDTVLGLKEHLTQQQLKKFGFRFFFSEGVEEIDRVVELGASRYLATPSYQLDRGIFENFLAQHAQLIGVRFVDGASVAGIALAEDGGASVPANPSSTSDASNAGNAQDAANRAAHEIVYDRDGQQQVVRAGWLVDASGRAGLLKRKLDLAEANDHDANAIWFRVGTRIDVDEWSADRNWLSRYDAHRVRA